MESYFPATSEALGLSPKKKKPEPEPEPEKSAVTAYVLKLKEVTKAAYEKVKAEGYYDKYPQQEVVITQVQRGTPTLNTMTVRLGNANQYVAALEEEMEAVWANKKTAQQAMDDAVRRGNEILRRFERQRGN